VASQERLLAASSIRAGGLENDHVRPRHCDGLLLDHCQRLDAEGEERAALVPVRDGAGRCVTATVGFVALVTQHGARGVLERVVWDVNLGGVVNDRAVEVIENT
jgi:hypothetical protein